MPSLRERKKQATREALHRSAIELTAERGLAGVTIDAIAERADVAPRTVFNYFASKEEAVLGHDPERIDRMVTALLGRPAGERVLDSLRHVILAEMMTGDNRDEPLGQEPSERYRQMLALVRTDRNLFAAHASLWSQFAQALTETVAVRTGLDASRDLFPSVVVNAAMAVMRAAMLRWSDTGGETALRELVAEALDSLAAGLPEPRRGRR